MLSGAGVGGRPVAYRRVERHATLPAYLHGGYHLTHRVLLLVARYLSHAPSHRDTPSLARIFVIQPIEYRRGSSPASNKAGLWLVRVDTTTTLTSGHVELTADGKEKVQGAYHYREPLLHARIVHM